LTDDQNTRELVRFVRENYSPDDAFRVAIEAISTHITAEDLRRHLPLLLRLARRVEERPR